MFNSIKNLLGLEQADYAQLVNAGAIILDVRSRSEYAAGHINGSINIAVQHLGTNLHALPDKDQPIITCCASGARSATAKSFLLANGYTHVFNGGGWNSLQNKIEG